MRNRFHRIRDWRNRTTIRKQLSLFVGIAVSTAIALLITFNFITQSRANERQQIDALARVLTLESQRLSNYLEELRTFSLQLRSNSTFMDIAAQSEPLTYAQREDVESALKSAYYARGDLVRVELYLTRQGQRYAMDSDQRKVFYTEDVQATDLADYTAFAAKPAFESMMPVNTGLLRYTRAIIDAPRTDPLAVVRLVVDRSAVDELVKNHLSAEEQICIYGAHGERYAVADGLTEADRKALFAGALGAAHSYTIRVGAVPTLCVATPTPDAAFVLVAFKPLTAVNAALIQTRNASIALGFAALALTMLLTETFIRYITEPLLLLAHRLRRVGTGNFKTKAQLEGSVELAGLSEDVNRMMADIDGLIDRTYVATLNERTAQLTALEAQTNPHFLFNTLQAIGSEALARGQMELYRMVTSLALLLRYAIRGGNLATLQDELSRVRDYLYLQQARFGDRLQVDVHTDDALLGLRLPKLGLLSLVENSIVHGLRGDVTSIRLQLAATVESGVARLTVKDDGCGIPPDQLAQLTRALEDPNVTITQNVGLMNLAGRFKLLYNGRARILLQSTDQPRETTVTLLIPLEVQPHAEGSAD